MKVSTWVDPDLAERVRRAAEKEGRSVSQWLRLLLEREMERRSWSEGLPAKSAGLVKTSEARTSLCSHSNVVKRQAESGGIVRECSDCGTRILR